MAIVVKDPPKTAWLTLFNTLRQPAWGYILHH